MYFKLSFIWLTLALSGCASLTPDRPVERQAERAPSVAVKKPKIALVLGGGAARGFAHIGVIDALEAHHIPISLVVGTSAGSVVAALYASGKNSAELKHVALSMEEAAFSDWRLPIFTSGVLKGEALAKFISHQVGGHQIQELPMKLGIVATDLHTGKGILFQQGDVATAVRASSAIPAVFQPVSISGRDYVDGGLVSPVPVSFARDMGADLIIAVDISNESTDITAKDTFQILMKTFAIMGNRINTFELAQADVVVKPVLKGLSSTRFSSRAEAIASGYQAMNIMLPQLERVIALRSK